MMFRPFSRWSRWVGRLLCTTYKNDKVPACTFCIENKYKSTYVHTCVENNPQTALLEHEIIVKASNVIILSDEKKKWKI